jgi:SAM-dependent methyltransferase
MQMPGRNASTEDYRYGFQGQESDREITGSESHIAWTYRCNDVRLGRFLSIDPLAPKYPHYSPYHFSSNWPIIAPELEGLESSAEAQFYGELDNELGYEPADPNDEPWVNPIGVDLGVGKAISATLGFVGEAVGAVFGAVGDGASELSAAMMESAGWEFGSNGGSVSNEAFADALSNGDINVVYSGLEQDVQAAGDAIPPSIGAAAETSLLFITPRGPVKSTKKPLKLNIGGEGEIAGFTDVNPLQGLRPGVTKESIIARNPTGAFIEAGAEALPLKNASASEIVARNLPSHVTAGKLSEPAAAEMVRVLQPGGTATLTTSAGVFGKAFVKAGFNVATGGRGATFTKTP